MDRALGHLKRSNPDGWKLARVGIVDKDLNYPPFKHCLVNKFVVRLKN